MTTSSFLLFLKQFRQDFFHIGAALPSSSALGRAGAAYVAQKKGSVRVLEAGAGTGSFTRQIIPLLEPGDTLDAVEINPHLIAHLRQRLQSEPGFQPKKGVTVNLINDDVRNISGEYDYIVFSLPLTNFPPALVEEILTSMMEHLKPGGVFSYVKYIFISRFKYWFGGAKTRQEMNANREIIDRFAAQYQIEKRAVMLNLPPTWVYYWRKGVEE